MKYIKLLRIKDWIKNLFIFIPPFFAGVFNDTTMYFPLLMGFLAFSFVASGIYIFNDYRDIEDDKIHPRKKLRQIASGKVSLGFAFTLMVVLLVGGLTIRLVIDKYLFVVLCIYMVLNISYSLGLKNISMLDGLILSSGFVIRIIAGGIISQVMISDWLVIMVFLLALFLALAKRRDDLLIYIDSNQVTRKSIGGYNLEFLSAMLAILSSVIIVAYIMYTISPNITERLQNEYVYATIIYVIAGIMRYLQIVFIQKKSGSPTSILFSDKFIIITLLGWITHNFIIIYSTYF